MAVSASGTAISMTGAEVLAQALKSQDIKYVFGIVGYPITEVAVAIQKVGIKFFAMRNEQAACYAASAIGYLTQRPGVCLVVSGPGLIHALGGLANANLNCWPVIVIGGSNDQYSKGAFQEFPQVESARLYTKYAARFSHLETIPFFVEKAVRMSTFGCPGACYLDIPGNLVNDKVPATSVKNFLTCPAPPVMLADPVEIKKSSDILMSAKKPLVIIGKGAAYGRAEKEIYELVNNFNLPFLPTPMGKGVISDEHPCNVNAARSRALLEADVILLFGARLNWILHFGLPPRFSSAVKFIQIDISPEEMFNNNQSCIALCGTVNEITAQLISSIKTASLNWAFSSNSAWWSNLKDKIKENEEMIRKLKAEKSSSMNYYQALHEIAELLPSECIIVNEVSNTMDIGQTMLPNYFPRHRLDAGIFGSMGVGLGFALAAAIYCQDHNPSKRVVCIQGDSAFGFAGMELETICRYHLPLTIIIINNNGISMAQDLETWKELKKRPENLGLTLPPHVLSPQIPYEKIMEAFGGEGYSVTRPDELRITLSAALTYNSNPYLINVLIDPHAQRKAQEFFWLTRSKM